MGNSFIRQARLEYSGTPTRIATAEDECGESHVVIEMVEGKETYYLDWIGAELALQPDEFNEVPPGLNLNWSTI